MCARCLDQLREAQSQNKDLSRQVQELIAIRHQLEADRDRLASELNDANEALRDAQARLDAANAALSQLKADFEHRLREKDEEIESIRCSRHVSLVYSAVIQQLVHMIETGLFLRSTRSRIVFSQNNVQ